MQIGIIGTANEYNSLVKIYTQNDKNTWLHFNTITTINEKLAVVFDFTYTHSNDYIATLKALNCIVFVNEVENIDTQFSKFNGWFGMYEKGLEVIFANTNDKAFLESIGITIYESINQPGLISARVVSMLINEAYYALGEQVSTKAEIDTAMQLGTNYPYGPFAWGEKIGLQKVVNLLNLLSNPNKTYTVAPALLQEINNK